MTDGPASPFSRVNRPCSSVVADGRFDPQISPRTAVALGTGRPAASTTRPETDRPFFRIVTLSRFRDATMSLLRKCGCVA